MNYSRKGSIVERVRDDKTRREGIIRLDKGSMTFFARIPDDAPPSERPAMMESKDGGAVKDWLVKELKKTTANELLDWMPVVQVEVAEPGYYYGRETRTRAGFKVHIARYYLALTRDRREWLKLKWEQADEESVAVLPPEDRVASSEKFRSGPGGEEKSAVRSHHGDRIMRGLPFFDSNTNYLPYTPEAWAGLLNVIDTVNTAEKNIRELVGTKKGLAMLMDNGVKQLNAGPVAVVGNGEEDDG